MECEPLHLRIILLINVETYARHNEIRPDIHIYIYMLFNYFNDHIHAYICYLTTDTHTHTHIYIYISTSSFYALRHFHECFFPGLLPSDSREHGDYWLKSIFPQIWSNYSDLTRPHPKWWFSNGNPLISGKSGLVKYYHLAR